MTEVFEEMCAAIEALTACNKALFELAAQFAEYDEIAHLRVKTTEVQQWSI